MLQQPHNHKMHSVKRHAMCKMLPSEPLPLPKVQSSLRAWRHRLIVVYLRSVQRILRAQGVYPGTAGTKSSEELLNRRRSNTAANPVASTASSTSSKTNMKRAASSRPTFSFVSLELPQLGDSARESHVPSTRFCMEHFSMQYKIASLQRVSYPLAT